MDSHLRNINEKYLEHMLCALKYSTRMILAGFALMIHAFLPNLFVTTASKTMHSILKDVEDRKNNKQIL